MFKNFRKKRWIVLGIITLVISNFVAFYILRKGIEISDALEHVEDETVRKSLEQKQVLSDVLPSLVFTIDIACILFLFYLLIKLFFKTLKKSTSKK